MWDQLDLARSDFCERAGGSTNLVDCKGRPRVRLGIRLGQGPRNDHPAQPYNIDLGRLVHVVPPCIPVRSHLHAPRGRCAQGPYTP